MKNETFEKRLKKECEDYNFSFDEIHSTLSPHYEILKYIEKKRSKLTTPTKFRNHLKFTQNTFLEINNHIKNDGYVKLAKRCDRLLKQLDFYQDENKRINPKMKKYFDDKFGKDLPTETNILSIAVDNLQDIKPNTPPDYLKDFICDVFERKRFTTKGQKWKTIRVDSIDLTITTEKNTLYHIQKAIKIP